MKQLPTDYQELITWLRYLHSPQSYLLGLTAAEKTIFVATDREITVVENQNPMSSPTEWMRSLFDIYKKVRTSRHLITGQLLDSHIVSPTTSGSLHQDQGNHQGRIVSAVNDYTRDQHLIGRTFEQAFSRQFIPVRGILPQWCYSTNSGMAALSTIIAFLQGEQYLNQGSIWIDQQCYFEEQLLLHQRLSHLQIIPINLRDNVASLMAQHPPAVLFLDTAYNAPAASPTRDHFIKLINQLPSTTIIVIDATATKGLGQLKSVFAKRQYIAWESLTKYHTYGTDLTTGGIIYGNIPNLVRMYTYRDHGGTTMSEWATTILPRPHQTISKLLWQRHIRNASLISKHLHHHLKNTAIQVYGGEDDNTPLLRISRSKTSARTYIRCIQHIVREAKKRNVLVFTGTSFGLPITRLYVPASRPGQGVPFIRIACGIEPISIVELLADSIVRGVNKL